MPDERATGNSYRERVAKRTSSANKHVICSRATTIIDHVARSRALTLVCVTAIFVVLVGPPGQRWAPKAPETDPLRQILQIAQKAAPETKFIAIRGNFKTLGMLETNMQGWAARTQT